MKTKINDGGPAYGHGDPTNGGDPGMSLRAAIAKDVVAALAPSIVFPQSVEDQLHAAGVKTEDFEAWTAHVAVGFADALIYELERADRGSGNLLTDLDAARERIARTALSERHE